MFLGHLVDLKAKAGGDNSMPEKREPLEDAEGAVPQDPCERAKAALPESQLKGGYLVPAAQGELQSRTEISGCPVA